MVFIIEFVLRAARLSSLILARSDEDTFNNELPFVASMA